MTFHDNNVDFKIFSNDGEVFTYRDIKHDFFYHRQEFVDDDGTIYNYEYRFGQDSNGKDVKDMIERLNEFIEKFENEFERKGCTNAIVFLYYVRTFLKVEYEGIKTLSDDEIIRLRNLDE